MISEKRALELFQQSRYDTMTKGRTDWEVIYPEQIVKFADAIGKESVRVFIEGLLKKVGE